MNDLFIDYDGKLGSDGKLIKKLNDNEHIKSFINCIDESKGFIIFAGAGLSKLCGLPLWGEFANKLLEQCCKDKLISFFEKEDLKKHVNNDKMLISIVYSKYQEAGLINKFNKIFKETLKNNPKNKKESRLVTAIKNLRASIITTNADKILDRCVLRENNYYGKKFDSLDESTLIDIFEDQPKIFHIHGSIKSKEGLVFTIEDYIDRYREPSFNKKVASLLNSDGIPVLFVGTSMTELELLQYILFKDNSGEKNRFILTGFYDYQESMAKTFEEYYKKFNITQITYSLNEKGYDLQLDFLDEISKYTAKHTSVPSKIYDDLLSCVKKGVIKSIVEDILLQEVSISNDLFDCLLVEINKLSNAESVYESLLKKNEKMFIISDLFLKNEKNKSKSVFYSFCTLNSIDKQKYCKVAKYYAENIMKHLKDSITDTSTLHRLLYNYIELLGKNQNLEKEMIEFFSWLMNNKYALVDEMVYALHKYNITARTSYEIGCNILDYYTSNESKFFDSEINSFFGKNLIQILKYDGYGFVNKIYETINNICEHDKFSYMDMGALCDYSKAKDYPKFNHFIIGLLDDAIKKTGFFVANELYNSIENDKIGKKVKVHLIDVFYNQMNGHIFDVELFNSIDTVAPLCWLIIHNRDNMSKDIVKELKEKINQSSFGCEEADDMIALRDILISKIDNIEPIIKNESRYYYWEFQNIGKIWWSDTKNYSIKKKEQLETTKDMNIYEFIDCVSTRREDDIFDFVGDTIGAYFSNKDNLIELLKNYKLFSKIKSKYHYSALKLIATQNDIDKGLIISFLNKIDFINVSDWIINDIIQKNNLISLYPSDCDLILRKKYEYNFKNNYDDYFDAKKEYSDYIINNVLYNNVRLLVQCKIKNNESIKEFYLTVPKTRNGVLVKMAIISQMDNISEDKEWFLEQIYSLLNNNEDYIKADIYEQLLFVNMDRLPFINDENFVFAFKIMNKRDQNYYIVESLFRFEALKENVLDFVCQQASIEDFSYFLENYFNNPNYNAEKISMLCEKVLSKKELDDFVFVSLLEVVARNKNDKTTKRLCAKFYKKQNQHMFFWEHLSESILKLVKVDEEFAIEKVLYNLANNFLDVSNYDFKDELFNLFDNILDHKLSIKSKETIKQLAIKAYNSGMLKFKNFIKIKI